MSNEKNLIRHLAEELQQYTWQQCGEKTPSVEDFEQFIADHVEKFGVNLLKEDKVEQKTAALLKPMADVSKRMRELAGIPHKDNFV